MGRPLEFDREEALEQAMYTFWSKGYKGASLQDLLQAMNLSKSSFYQSFKSKRELFQRSINHYRHLLSQQMWTELRSADSGRQFIEQNLFAVAGEAALPEGRTGCLVMNSATELGLKDPDIARLVQTGIADFEAVFMAAVRQAQAEGEIADDKDAPALARYLVTNRSGLKTMAKAGASPRSLEEVIRITLKALD